MAISLLAVYLAYLLSAVFINNTAYALSDITELEDISTSYYSNDISTIASDYTMYIVSNYKDITDKTIELKAGATMHISCSKPDSRITNVRCVVSDSTCLRVVDKTLTVLKRFKGTKYVKYIGDTPTGSISVQVFFKIPDPEIKYLEVGDEYPISSKHEIGECYRVTVTTPYASDADSYGYSTSSSSSSVTNWKSGNTFYVPQGSYYFFARHTESGVSKPEFCFAMPFANAKTIDILNKPTKLKYSIGEKVDLTGSKVKITWPTVGVQSRAPVTTIPYANWLLPYDSNTLGVKTITIKIGNAVASFDVEYVNGIKQAELEGLKTNYVVGEDFVEQGKIKVSYHDGTSEEVQITESMLTGFDTSTPGNHEVTVTYKDITLKYTINVIEELPIEIDVNIPNLDDWTGPKVAYVDATPEENLDHVELPDNRKVYKDANIEYIILNNGNYNFTAHSKDNINKASKQVLVSTIDNQPPLITIGYNKYLSKVAINAIDNVGIDKVILPDGTVVPSRDLPILLDTNDATVGTVLAYDTVGNISAKDFTIDSFEHSGDGGKTYHTYVGLSGIPDNWTNTSVNVNIAAYSPNVSIDGIDVTPKNSRRQLRQLSRYADPELASLQDEIEDILGEDESEPVDTLHWSPDASSTLPLGPHGNVTQYNLGADTSGLLDLLSNLETPADMPVEPDEPEIKVTAELDTTTEPDITNPPIEPEEPIEPDTPVEPDEPQDSKYNMSVIVEVPENGSYNYAVKNIFGVYEKTFQVDKIDKVAPEISPIAVLDGVIPVEISDNLSGIYSIEWPDGKTDVYEQDRQGVDAAIDRDLDPSNLTFGEHTITVTDYAGNVTTSTFTLDEQDGVIDNGQEDEIVLTVVFKSGEPDISFTPLTYTVKSGDSFTLISLPDGMIPSGASFDHWCDENDITYQPGDVIENIVGNRVFYLKAKYPDYNITIDPNGTSLQPKVDTVRAGDQYTWPTAETLENQEFIGYSTSPLNEEGSTLYLPGDLTIIDQDITVYVIYKEIPPEPTPDEGEGGEGGGDSGEGDTPTPPNPPSPDEGNEGEGGGEGEEGGDTPTPPTPPDEGGGDTPTPPTPPDEGGEDKPTPPDEEGGDKPTPPDEGGGDDGEGGDTPTPPDEEGGDTPTPPTPPDEGGGEGGGEVTPTPPPKPDEGGGDKPTPPPTPPTPVPTPKPNGGSSSGGGGGGGGGGPRPTPKPTPTPTPTPSNPSREETKGLDSNGKPFQLNEGITISTSIDAGYIKGKPGNLFDSDGVLTRAEFAVILDRVFKFKDTSINTSFTDVSAGWCVDSINLLASRKVVLGTGNNEFKPDAPITIEQALMMLSRIVYMEGYADTISGVKLDASMWANKNLAKAVNSGIATLEDINDAESNITRKQVVRFINLIVYKDLKTDKKNIFKDISVGHPYYADILKSILETNEK